MSKRIPLCRADEVLADTPVQAQAEGLPVLAVYRVDEAFYVTSDVCTHGSASLSEGAQEGTTIECPFHGGIFDVRTGEALAFPCRVALKTYEVALEDGWVCVVV